MFQVPPVTVNEGLVQFPCDCVRGTSTAAVPVSDVAAVVGVIDAAIVVEGEDPTGTVVAVIGSDAGGTVTVVDVDEPDGGGMWYSLPPALEAGFGVVLAVALSMYRPTKSMTTPNARSCHVFHDRFSRIPS